ncbi:alpha/beta-hydrolase [Tothia fuscella]|uniref:Alpha/beta-hydrolase n=1 Tax=Tothia fuscella TaxID=1048955 RepID=A0A9P4NZU4_9PEZI|nr:alpha/beta-hydrolase [Tothia fuscella]
MRYSTAAVAALASVVAAQKEAGCGPLELVYARATTEPVGLGAAGKNLWNHLQKDLPGSSVYAVNYPASMDLNGGGCKGVNDLVSHLQKRSAACPNMKFALGGHSQGGAVVTAAGPKLALEKAIVNKIVAITMFGSPPCSDFEKPAGVAPLLARCKSFCNKGDTICDGGGGGPRVKCPGVGGKSTMLSQTFVDQMRFYSGENLTEALEARQLPKGAKGAGGAPSGASGAGSGCGADERGHAIKGGGSGMAAHMAYNQDGYYTEAASCYITKQFKSMGGGAGAAGA